MTEIRTLNVPMKLIERAATNQDYCKALALTLMFSANFAGAQFSDYGMVKLKRILHVGFYNLRRTLRHAVDENLLYLCEYTKKGKRLTALKCTKFPKARAYVRFQMCKTRHGMKIFMKSKLQNNCCRYRKDRKSQRLADVPDGSDVDVYSTSDYIVGIMTGKYGIKNTPDLIVPLQCRIKCLGKLTFRLIDKHNIDFMALRSETWRWKNRDSGLSSLPSFFVSSPQMHCNRANRD